MVANAMLAAMAKHACKPGLKIYHIASSMVNPCSLSNNMRFLEEHFQEEPLIDNTGKPIRNMKFQTRQIWNSWKLWKHIDISVHTYSQIVQIEKFKE